MAEEGGGGGAGGGGERTVASETAERSITSGGRPRATVVADIDRSAPRTRHKHGVSATVDSSSWSKREYCDNVGKREVYSPVFRRAVSPPADRGKDRDARDREWASDRSAEKVSVSRREKDKGSSRSSPRDKSFSSASSKDRAARSPEKSHHREGSRDGSSGRNRRDSSTSKRGSPVSKDHASHRQHEIHSLADNGGVRDTGFIYSSKVSADKDSRAIAGKEHSRERAATIEADVRRKERALEKQKSRDGGLGKTLDRAQSREVTRIGPLEKQSSRDSGTGRSLEGQSPREADGSEASEKVFPPSTVTRDSDRRGLRDRSRTVEGVGADPSRDHGREKPLPKHSSADSATTKPFRKVSRDRTLERQVSVDDSRLGEPDQPRDNPFRQVLKEATADRRERHTSVEKTRTNPQKQSSRERIIDRQTSTDETKANPQRHVWKERTLDRQTDESKRSRSDERDEHYYRQFPAKGLVDRQRSIDKTGETEFDQSSENPRRQLSRERTLDRPASIGETREAALDDRRNDRHRKLPRDRDQGTRSAIDEIQLKEYSTPTGTHRRPISADRTLSRDRSVEETHFREETNVREKDRRSTQDNYARDRQTVSDAGNPGNAGNDGNPQRRISRDKTLDRQFSIDESRQISRDGDGYDSRSRTSRRVTDQQSGEAPVAAERRSSRENSARQNRGDVGREGLLRVHGRSSQDANADSSLGRVRRTRQPVENIELKALEGPRGDEPHSYDAETERRSAGVHRKRRESESQTFDKRWPERQFSEDRESVTVGTFRDTPRTGAGGTTIPDRQHSHRTENRSVHPTR